MGRPPITGIETARLRLIRLRPEDAAEMVEVLSDPSLYAFIGGTPPTLAELDARYRGWADGSPRPDEAWHNWLIRLRDGAAVGHAQATVTAGGRRADIAWLIGAPWQGRGYAREAAKAVVDWLEGAGVAEVTAHIHPEHVASGRVAASAGLEATAAIEDGEVVWRRVRA